MENRTGRRLVLMGVAGCGKSTVGAGLSARLGIPYIDGDDLHPAENVARMSRGEPLGDADRWPWLDRVAAALAERQEVIIGCSALRRRYRDRTGGRRRQLLQRQRPGDAGCAGRLPERSAPAAHLRAADAAHRHAAAAR